MTADPFERLAQKAKVTHAQRPRPEAADAALDAVVADLQAAGITLGREQPYDGGGQLWELAGCPYSDDHEMGAYLVQYADGGVYVRCHHDRCRGKTYQDAPGAFTRTLDALRGKRPGSTNGPHDEPANCAYVHCANGRSQFPEYPVDVFPESIQRYVKDGAAALNVPVGMIAVPLIGFAAGAIGNTRAVLVKPGWVERANLWLAVIGDAGSGKSPALSYARAPLDALQRGAWEENAAKVLAWERVMSELKGRPGDSTPQRPILEHYFTSDATTEALAGILATSPGVAIAMDELVGWVRSHDAYRKGGDRQAFLSLWTGSAPLKVDRKGAPTLFVPHPVVPIVGGVQPDLLPDLGDEGGRRDGFVERILMCWPDPLPIAWSEQALDTDARAGVSAIFRRLRAPGDGLPIPTPLDDQARQLFASWFVENGAIVQSSQGIAAGCYAKYPAQVARIALVLHALHHPDADQRTIDDGVVADAIRVIEFFRAHLVAVLPRFGATGSTRNAGLETRIRRILGNADGGWVARRELRRGLGNSVDAASIEEALAMMATRGEVESRTVATGARPRQESRLVVGPPHSHNAPMHNSGATPSPPGSDHAWEDY